MDATRMQVLILHIDVHHRASIAVGALKTRPNRWQPASILTSSNVHIVDHEWSDHNGWDEGCAWAQQVGSLSARLIQPWPLLNIQPIMSRSQLGLYNAPCFRLSTSHLVVICLHGNPFTWKWQWFVSTGITHTLGVGLSLLMEYLGLHQDQRFTHMGFRITSTQSKHKDVQSSRWLRIQWHILFNITQDGNLIKYWKSLLKAQMKCWLGDVPHGVGVLSFKMNWQTRDGTWCPTVAQT